LIEDQTGGTMPPGEATAEAPTSEERVATTAVATARGHLPPRRSSNKKFVNS
jgi:hypothetical protein